MFDTGIYVSTDGAELFVAEAGKPGGMPVVLLHGGLGNRLDFVPLVRLLSAEYRVIAIDTRGHGRSTFGDKDLTYRLLAADVACVLDRLGVSEAGIVGHSDGGIVALRLAASHQVRPRFVAVVGAHWQLPEDDPVREIYQGISEIEWREMYGPQVDLYESQNPTSPDSSTPQLKCGSEPEMMRIPEKLCVR